MAYNDNNNYNGQNYYQNYSNYNQGYNNSGYNDYNNGGQAYGGYREISPTAYNLALGGTLFYGFIVNCLMVQFAFDSIAGLFISSPVVFYILYFAMAFAGTFMVNKSKSAAVSFIGYNLIVVPLGMIIALVVNSYVMSGYAATVSTAFAITAVVTLIMMFISSIAPNFFLSIGRTLGVTLLVTILIEVVMMVAGFDLTIIDYLVVLIFCGYIGYDWARANALPKTFDNAIDSAAELYVDIVNLFLRILRILARSQNN